MKVNCNHKRQGFNYPINGLRGFAILLVFLHHVQTNAFAAGFMINIKKAPVLVWILDNGQYSVELFFMISGFLTTASLIRNNNIYRFVLNRCIRIYPVFLCLHVLVFTVGPFINYKFLADTSFWDWFFHFFTNVIFLPGIFQLPRAQVVAWYLSYEALFYLVAALSCFISIRLSRYYAIVFIVCISIPIMYLYPRTSFFLIGVIVLYKGEDFVRKFRILNFPLIWLFIFFFAWNLPGPNGTELTNKWVWSNPYPPGLIALFAGFLAFTFIVNAEGFFSKVLCNRFFQFFGNISYSFYLFHTLLMFVVRGSINKLVVSGAIGQHIAIIIFAIISFILACIVSLISYRLIEQGLSRKLKCLFT